nr:receptor homology region, transmembrane domain-and RING domain-containing protein 2-like [Ipomoea batatas]GMD80814.1 receptor homology region, transmembrane domain-and RING domain-containing protein 2-like [Ipomoea batatas]
MNFRELLFFLCLGSMMSSTAFGKVLLIGRDITLTFADIEALFTPPVESRISGTLYMAEPLNACSPLTNKLDSVHNSTKLPFVLIARGGECSFSDKVSRAQTAGFKAAIIYDNVVADLATMGGCSAGIQIPAVFVSKASGEILARFAGDSDMDVWITPRYEVTWPLMVLWFFLFLAAAAMLVGCCISLRDDLRSQRRIPRHVKEVHGMSSRLVKTLPSSKFTAVKAVVEDNCTSTACAICLEDYSTGDKLRILPCSHKFHAICVDAWLTSRRTFCPVCKRDARTRVDEPLASESTPLLSSTSYSPIRSTLATAAEDSRPHSLHSSFHQLPHRSTDQSSVDISNASSPASCLDSTHSMVYPSLSSMYQSYSSQPNASSASSIVSSSQHPNPPLQRTDESNPTFSPFNSAHSLPDCQV